MQINSIIDKLKEKSFKQERIPLPKDETSYDFNKRLTIEIGCGVGLHPILYAQSHPDSHIFAIEHTTNKFQKFNRRLDNHSELNNITPIHENAISWITHKVPDNSVEQYILMYPNPNPKANDWNKRWFCMPFFSKLISTLKEDGTILLVTNEEFYVNEARIVNKDYWKLVEVNFREFNSIDRARTHFEKKYLSRGETCYELLIKKSKNQMN